MKILLLILAILFIPVAAQAQVLEFKWGQPTHTVGNPDQGIPPTPIPDGGILKYEIFKATPGDTIYYGEVVGPHAIADSVIAAVPAEMYIPVSIRVRAIDTDGKTGVFSLWSEPFTVEPGPPDAASKPEPIRVYFGG